MKNAEYWRRRFEAVEQLSISSGSSYLARVEKEFTQASRRVEQEIASWYERFAVNNSVSMADARKLLTSGQLQELKWSLEDYIKYGQENFLNGQWIRQLENASARVHISRLEALQLEIQQQAEALYGSQLDGLDGLVRKIYSDGYYHSAFEIQKGFNIGWDLTPINPKQIEKVMSTPWTLDRQTFSDRIWTQKQALIGKVQTELTQGMIRGDAPDVAIKAISDQFGVSKRQAGRLVMTESAYFASEAQREAFSMLGVERFEIVATLDNHTSALCQSLDGIVADMRDYEPGVTAPPFHPWCRSVTAPYFDDDFGERIARGEDNETYYVPSDMAYGHWYSKFVEPSVVTEFDKEVIIRYVGGGSYALNGKLREGVRLTKDESSWVERLNLALSKMPDYSGDVQRALLIGDKDDLTEFLLRHTIGSELEYPAFTSFSKLNGYNSDANIQIFAISRNGKDISTINAGEQEVLYPTNSRFSIVNYRLSGGVHYILLEEL